MKPLACPHCGLEVEVDNPATAAICPSCYNWIHLPRSTQWTALIVPFLAIHQLMLHGF